MHAKHVISTVLLLFVIAFTPGCDAVDDGGNNLFVVDYSGDPFTLNEVWQESWGAFWLDENTLQLEYSPEPFEDLATRQILSIELKHTAGPLPELEDIFYGIRTGRGETRAEWKVIRGRIAIQDWDRYGVVSADVDLELEDRLTVKSRFWIDFTPREE